MDDLAESGLDIVAPSRVRGLKLDGHDEGREKRGRTLTGAWIEAVQ